MVVLKTVMGSLTIYIQIFVSLVGTPRYETHMGGAGCVDLSGPHKRCVKGGPSVCWC